MTEVKQFLDSLHPAAAWFSLSFLVGAVVFGWRKLSPSSFEKLPPALQSLPAVLLGAVAGAAQGGDVKAAFIDAALGALAGLTAVGGHHAIKAAVPSRSE